jgi:hypothetical protein
MEVYVSKPQNTLVAAFDDRVAAQNAVTELEAAGFDDDSIGFVLRGSDAVRGGMITDASGAKDATGAAQGALTGGMVGGVLGAAASLLVPGVGPILAGGVLASFFGGAIAGTAVGGMLGAMTGLGISEDEARYFEEQFQSGKAIVAVKPEARVEEAARILRGHGGYDLHNRLKSPIKTEGAFSQP